MSFRKHRLLVVGVLATTAVGTLVSTAPAATARQTRQARQVQPSLTATQVRTIGGPGHALIYPSGAEISPDGTIVVADTGNDQIRKFASDGTLIWSVGSTGGGAGQFSNPRDVGIDTAGNIYVSDDDNAQVVKLGPDGTLIDQWVGADHGFSSPIGISVRGGKVYVADAPNRRLVILNTSGVVLATYGSESGCTFFRIRDADADADGNIYVDNYEGNNILKLTPGGTCVKSWGTKGSGPTQFHLPYGTTVRRDPVLDTEVLYVADSANHRIEEYSLDGVLINTVGTFGAPDEPGTISYLRRVAAARNGSGDVWAVDLWGHRLIRYARTPTGFVYSGQQIGGDPSPLTDTSVFNEVRKVDFDSTGKLVVIDTVNQRFDRFTPDGHVINACGVRGSRPGQFNWPRGLAVDRVTDEIWVADTKRSRLQIIKGDCTFVKEMGSRGPGLQNLNWPHDISIRDSDRTAFIGDALNHRIVQYDVATRTAIGAFGTKGTGNGQFTHPEGIGINPVNGHVFVGDKNNDRVVEIQGSGSSISFVRTLTGFSAPVGIAVNSAGVIAVADSGNNRVVLLNQAGAVLTTITGLSSPEDVAFNSAGELVVSDTQADIIRVYALS